MSGRLRDASGGEGSATGPSERPTGEPSLFVGYIQSVVGSCSLTRADGAVVQAKAGDPVCQGDVIETAADGQIAIHFIDDTVFNLSGNSRLALNEIVCGADGASQSGRFDAARGSFASRAGQAAKAVSPATETRVENNQDRARSGGIGSLTLAGMTFAILDQAQAQNLQPPNVNSTVFFHNGAFLDDGVLNYKDMAHGIVELILHNDVRTPGVPAIQYLSDPGESIFIQKLGSGYSIDYVTNTPTDMLRFESIGHDAIGTFGSGAGWGDFLRMRRQPDRAVSFRSSKRLIFSLMASCRRLRHRLRHPRHRRHHRRRHRRRCLLTPRRW